MRCKQYRGATMATVKWLLVLVLLSVFMTFPSYAQQNQREDQLRTCEAVLGDRPASAECAKSFARDADCCIQYDAERLAKLCAKMSSTENALTCFSEIHEVGFWKTELGGENEPGLGAQHAEQWKKNVMRECLTEPSQSAALTCAIRQKSGTKYVYGKQNAEVARRTSEADPIMKFCRQAFGDYWQGVEQCIKEQRAAKKRLGH